MRWAEPNYAYGDDETTAFTGERPLLMTAIEPKDGSVLKSIRVNESSWCLGHMGADCDGEQGEGSLAQRGARAVFRRSDAVHGRFEPWLERPIWSTSLMFAS